jgi:hypothetical protein
LDFRDAASHSAGVNALLFDTLRLSRILRDKGHFTSEQAEALAEALGEASHGDLATKADLADLATKADLADLATKAELAVLATKADLANLATKADLANLATKADLANLATKADLAAVRTEVAELKTELKTEIAEMRVEIAGTKTELLKWIIGAIGFQTVVILGALISLIRLAAK